jgi:hypothetical protein
MLWAFLLWRAKNPGCENHLLWVFLLCNSINCVTKAGFRRWRRATSHRISVMMRSFKPLPFFFFYTTFLIISFVLTRFNLSPLRINRAKMSRNIQNLSFQALGSFFLLQSHKATDPTKKNSIVLFQQLLWHCLEWETMLLT